MGLVPELEEQAGRSFFFFLSLALGLTLARPGVAQC